MDLELRVASVLGQDALLKQMLLQAPSAECIPFRGSRAKFYLLVSLCLQADASEFNRLAYACLAALRLIVGSELLTGLSGVEIVPYIADKENFRRVFRLSVESNALDVALRMESADLLRGNLAPGVTCGWYLPKPATQ